MAKLVKVEKCFLIIVNIIFTLLAMTAVGFGAALVYRSEHTENKLFTFFPEIDFIPKTIVILGTAMTILYFIGFFGALREKIFLLQFYAAVLLLMLLLKVILFIYLMTTSSTTSEIKPSTLSPYEIAFKEYGKPGQEQSTEFVDAIQYSYKCCGYKSYEEMRDRNGTLPVTCCGLVSGTCFQASNTMQFKTCYLAIKEYGDIIWYTSRVMYYIVVILQTFCMIAAFHLASAVESKSQASKSVYTIMT